MEKTFLTGLIIVLPILLTRFLLTSLLNKEAVKRAAFFPPTSGIEKPAYFVNIATTLLLMIVPFFLKISFSGLMGLAGLCLLIMSLVMYGVSIVQFARPNGAGLNTSGLYGISRNPMYVAFFFWFLGGCMLTRSWLLLAILMVFQVSVHFMILAEERWCREKFGEPYEEYMKKVRRYL
jgi:protein-S-isoprenylcysteine O-methyltransferase Ste14